MSLQTIIDRAESIGIDTRRVVASTLSRNQKLLTATRSSTQPWRFTVTPTNGYRWDGDYYDYTLNAVTPMRRTVAAVEAIDRHTSATINLAKNTGMHWVTQYQGDLTAGERGDMTINSFSGTTLVMNLGTSVQALPSGTILFEAGDIIQPANSAYPYKVQSRVTRGSGTTRTVTTHRPLIPETGVSVSGQLLKFGIDCTWTVKVGLLPSYTITPDRFVEWSGNFELIEVVA